MKLLWLKKKKKLLWSLLTIDSAVSVNSLHPCDPEVRQRKVHPSFLPRALLCLCLQRNSNLLQIAWAVCSCTAGEQHYFSSLAVNKLLLTCWFWGLFFSFLCTLLRKSSMYHGLLSFGITTSALMYCPCCNDHLKLDWAYWSPLCEGQSNILPWSVTECVNYYYFFSNGFPSSVSLVLGFYQTIQMLLIWTLPSLRLTRSQTDLIFWLEPGYEKVKNLQERKEENYLFWADWTVT